MFMESMGSTQQEAAEAKRKLEEVAAANKLSGDGFSSYSDIKERAISQGMAMDHHSAGQDEMAEMGGGTEVQTTHTRSFKGPGNQERAAAYESGLG